MILDALASFLEGLLAHEGSIWKYGSAAFICYTGGVLASLTPCVYPLIPVTLGVIGGTGATKKSWKEITLLGFFYVFGMSCIYSFLGVLAGLTGKVFGTLTQSMEAYLSVSLIFTFSALWMLDIFSFDPFVFFQSLKRKFLGKFKKQKKNAHHLVSFQKELSFLGAFLLGISSGVIAAPCTTPILSALLAFIAQTQSVGLGFFLMFAFSFGLGTLLLVLVTFAGAFSILPRSGKWMKGVKVGSGVGLLFFAEYLMYRAGSLSGGVR